jgi:hypothetical protein
VHGAPDALEVLNPAGWFYRLDPAAIVNCWPCGPHWSWISLDCATKGPLLVRGNAMEILQRRGVLLRQRSTRHGADDRGRDDRGT